MVLRDRLMKGFLAGVTGGVIMNIFDFSAFYLKLEELRFLDWAAIVFTDSMPHGFAETAFALLVQIVFSGMLGIFFAYTIPKLTSRNLLLKGWLFGIAVWFVLYGLLLLFEIPGIIPFNFKTSISDFVIASIFGIVMAETLRILDKGLTNIK